MPHMADTERQSDVVFPDPPSAEALVQAKRRNYARYVLAYSGEHTRVENSPLSVFLESATACNFRCAFCALRLPSESRRGKVMDQSLMASVIPMLPELANLSLHGFGEPLLNRALLPAAVAGVAHGAQVGFFTNGSLLNREAAERLVDARVPRFTVSISTADPELYAKLYEPGDLGKPSANLTALRDLKRSAGTDRPAVDFNMIAMRSTLPGLRELVRYAAEMGVRGIAVKPLVVYPGLEVMNEERLTYEPSRDEAVLEESRGLAASLGVSLQLEPYLRTLAPEQAEAEQPGAGGTPDPPALPEQVRLDAPCPLVFSSMYVGVDGLVRPCCFAAGGSGRRGDSDYVDLSMGNAEEQSLAEIWNGPAYRRIREQHIALEVPPQCSHCVCSSNWPRWETKCLAGWQPPDSRSLTTCSGARRPAS